jgi:hypothetical protein
VSQPFPPPVPDWAASTPDWPGAAGWRPSPAAPSPWSAAPQAPQVAATAAPRGSTPPWVLGLVVLGGVVAGAVGGAFIVAAVFVGSAEAIGEGIARGMVAAEEDLYGSMSEEDMGWYAEPPDPADISAPVAPAPGPDPVLDAYAQSCFQGDYQACDDLYFESPPLSDYEEYGGSCAGRVKIYSVASCTDLD